MISSDERTIETDLRLLYEQQFWDIGTISIGGSESFFKSIVSSGAAVRLDMMPPNQLQCRELLPAWFGGRVMHLKETAGGAAVVVLDRPISATTKFWKTYVSAPAAKVCISALATHTVLLYSSSYGDEKLTYAGYPIKSRRDPGKTVRRQKSVPKNTIEVDAAVKKYFIMPTPDMLFETPRSRRRVSMLHKIL